MSPQLLTIEEPRLPLEISGGSFLGSRYPSDFKIAQAIAAIFMPGADWMKYTVVEGQPSSKARHRQMANGSVWSPSSKREKAFKAQLASKFPEPAVLGNLAVVCVFFRASRQRIDTDNLLKFALDAATGTLWHDDSQVTAIAGFLEYEPLRPRTIMVLGPHKSSMKREGVFQHTLTCRNCGVEFTSWNRNARFCDRVCWAKSNEKLAGEIACARCGEPFRRRITKQIFCSQTCRAAAMADRNTINAISLPKCKICGKELSRHGYTLCRECWRTAR